ncbi:hypothetical protein CRG98_005394, partial [Punica granatum]
SSGPPLSPSPSSTRTRKGLHLLGWLILMMGLLRTAGVVLRENWGRKWGNHLEGRRLGFGEKRGAVVMADIDGVFGGFLEEEGE